MSEKLELYEIEPIFLLHCVKDRIFFLKIKDFISKTFFTNENIGIVFEVLKNFQNKYKKLPEEKTLKSLFTKKYKEEAKTYLNIINFIYTSEESYDKQYIEENIIDFIKQNKVIEAIKKSILLLENKEFSQVYEEIKKSISINFDKNLGLSFTKDSLKTIKECNKPRLSTGYVSLDIALSGGFEEGCLYTFSGIYGIGKSIWLQNLAIKQLLNGKNVIYYSLELSEKAVMRRLISQYTQVSQKEFLDRITEITKQYETLKMITDSELIVKSYPPNYANIHMLEAHAEEIFATSNKKPDVIIIDYTNILAPLKNISSENTYVRVKTLFEETRALAIQLNIPIVTAAQINRGGMDEKNGGTKKVVTGANISDSLGIGMTVDAHFVINQTGTEKDDGVMRLFVDKNRQGNQKFFLDFNIQYETLTIVENGNI
jgi:replicative DNA helicase